MGAQNDLEVGYVWSFKYQRVLRTTTTINLATQQVITLGILTTKK